MTNTKLLERYIRKNGLKISFVAKELNLDYRTLRNKITNVSEFKASEIEKLCQLLKITSLTDRQAIFFATKVD